MSAMKKVCFILLLSMLTILPCASEETPIETKEKAPVVFVYHIPDDDELKSEETELNSNTEEVPDIISDDVTADTSPDAQNQEQELENGENYYANNEENDEYEISDLYSDVLKGYASYNEDEEDEITLDFNTTPLIQIDIKQPLRIGTSNYTQLKTTPLKFYDNSYSKFYIPEFRIVPMSSTSDAQLGVVRIGATYNEYIDSGELEQTSGVFSQYRYKNFSIKTSYTKTINSTNNNYNDKVFFSPELKLNQYFTLISNFSADITKRNKRAEIMFSINPLGNRDPDFMRIDIGANQTYSELSDTFKSQFRFATRFNF